MFTDIYTIVWKEFKEIFLQRGSLRGGMATLLILIFVVGVFLPLQSGRQWVESPVGLIAWSWLPLFLVMSTIADTIAGERERHTLETLLASRLSDRAILLGKLAASVLYGWGTAMAAVLVGALTVNVTVHAGTILFYPPLLFAGVAVVSLLAALLMACIGILVSLNAETVRQAYQRLSIGFLAIWFVPILGLQIMPQAWRATLLQSLNGVDPLRVVLIFAVVLIVADAALLGVAFSRFQRSKLVLD